MKITMNDSRLANINQLKQFLKGSQKLDLSLRKAGIDDKYKFINQTADRFKYFQLRRKEKRVVLAYLKKITGYKKAQLYRLLKRTICGKLERKKYHRINPSRIYTVHDIKLLEKTDELHLRLSEKATREIFRREHEIFDNREYQTIAKVSHSHITNLRHSSIYRNSWVNHTKARQVPIGITMKPENYGKPGSIRVDTVHQRDIYHINSVDEITQWEIVVCVPQICEDCMKPALLHLLSQYPFIIFNFHSDRGGETINYIIADMLQKLLIKQTKNRARRSNDNALAETKNGSIIRKNMGWEHINQSFCNDINYYYKNYFNPYLNYHRPCGFPTSIVDKKGKEEKIYDVYQVPYERLKSILEAKKFLKPKTNYKKLDKIAYSMSDNQFAEILRKEEKKLFEKIRAYDKRRGSHRKFSKLEDRLKP